MPRLGEFFRLLQGDMSSIPVQLSILILPLPEINRVSGPLEIAQEVVWVVGFARLSVMFRWRFRRRRPGVVARIQFLGFSLSLDPDDLLALAQSRSVPAGLRAARPARTRHTGTQASLRVARDREVRRQGRRVPEAALARSAGLRGPPWRALAWALAPARPTRPLHPPRPMPGRLVRLRRCV